MTLESRIVGGPPNNNQDFTMRKWLIIEFVYITKEKNEEDVNIAPLGSKEIDGKWYLFGFDIGGCLRIFDMENITHEIGFYWGTYSLPETQDFEQIATQYFSLEQVE